VKLKLINKKSEAKNTVSYTFEPEKKLKWLPGQYLYITIPKLAYKDRRGPTRQFTVSSSPTEGDLLRLTTRIRESSGFKKSLDEIAIGEEVEAEGPSGSYIFDESGDFF